MPDYYLVHRTHGPAWDDSLHRREQPRWAEHARFMDGLVEDGFVVLGGPVGEGDGHSAMLVIAAADEDEIHARLAGDPWGPDMLRTASVTPWTILLRAPGAAALQRTSR